ncbi:peptidoglycan-binding protein [Streptomyces lancefieldiae]|uniref:Peptidoglycan-binding protein n=1 Tax=Streptomyces lancefieldiae TaxID=3075520 RepID=A0ABU3AT50_9ACTN|nr:peptidoglycan-binding protein [Streptomyces sp. DSM 40712]MDT0613356.1 peptidoglycan-binding protein [Streptomyces sp. DSM 40712]
METPVFEEIDPASDCECPGCRHWRHVLPYSPAGRAPAHPAAHRVLIVATAAASALGATHAAAAPAIAHAPPRPGVSAGEERDTPQGPRAPLHGRTGRPVGPPATVEPVAITRAEIIERARAWVTAKVPYSVTAYWSDGYRQDCSGYVSMAWKLPTNEWTGSLGAFADRITKEELEPGDILLFHNASDPQTGSHVVIFGGWTDRTHTTYTAYEQTSPHTRALSTPYAYWSNSAQYLPYRYKGVTASTAGTAAGAPSATSSPAASPSSRGASSPYPGASSFGPGVSGEHVTELERAAGPGPAPAAGPASHGVAGYPGRALFRPGAHNPYVTRLGRQLVKKGFGTYYTTGPGPRWGEADRRGVEAFQRAQGWRGGAADGHPGPETWRRLFS